MSKLSSKGKTTRRTAKTSRTGKTSRKSSRTRKTSSTRKSTPKVPKTVTYTTGQIESSIVLLDSREDPLVMEALVYLSRYADLQRHNLIYLLQKGLLSKLLNMFDRNKCILRLVLKLMVNLLSIDEALPELDQEEYDGKILQIRDMYQTSHDYHVKLYTVSLLAKLAKSCRIICLIYKQEIFKSIVDAITKQTDMALFEHSLELFFSLMSAPSSPTYIPRLKVFDMSNIVKHLDNAEPNIALLCFQVSNKLTYFCPYTFEGQFKKIKLVERMLTVVVTSSQEQYHEIAFDTIGNCMESETVCCSFVKSLEFLEFSQWAKGCDPKYHFLCAVILEHLTRISKIKQMLFNLSVEESILSFLRSNEKIVLNKVCEAIMNMNTNEYCMMKFLQPGLIKDLVKMLLRVDEEDPLNEVALQTIADFARRADETYKILYNLRAHKLLLNYFNKKHDLLSEQGLHGLLEILFSISLDPIWHHDVLSFDFFLKLLHIFDISPPEVAGFVCERLSKFISYPEFRNVISTPEGHQIFLNKVKNPTSILVLKETLLFFLANIKYEDIANSFLHHSLIEILKDFPETLKLEVPLVGKLMRLIYNHHPSLKFFETGRLDIADKLGDRFCLISGYWKYSFPILAELEARAINPDYAVYVVDYSVRRVLSYQTRNSSDNTLQGTINSYDILSPTWSKTNSSMSSDLRRGLINTDYNLYPDVVLPRYVNQMTKNLTYCSTLQEKVKALAVFVEDILGAPEEEYHKMDKIHNVMLHVAFLKSKVGNNLVPIGYLRKGNHCERALLFKAIADKTQIPASLVRGNFGLYWNEVALFDKHTKNTAKLYVVDLVHKIGDLLEVGSREANYYCKRKT